jgi:hypothetical protein
MIREIHGVVGLRVEPALSAVDRAIRTIDAEDYIVVQCGTDAAKLTSQEARCLARQLNAAAVRLEKRDNKK